MNQIESQLIETIDKVIKEAYDVTLEEGVIMIEIPKDRTNGDYSTNIAMRLTKILKQNPQSIAKTISDALLTHSDIVTEVAVAGPGFINFWIKKDKIANVINVVLNAKENYGRNNSGNNASVNVEYISANPTGNLHLGHARGAAWGDCITRLYRFSGYDCLREYYINDAGNQIENLAKSIRARYLELYKLPCELPEDGYHGKDIIELAQKIKDQDQDKWLNMSMDETISYFKSVGTELKLDQIKEDLAYYRVQMDSWISELELLKSKKVEAVLEEMQEKGLTYNLDNAIWFKSTEYGDDKDRVLRKSDGSLTYLTPDIANHVDKINRGSKKLVNLWGADHHGYICRMKASLEALGYGKDVLDVDIIQMVRLVEDGEEVKMSKRTGNAITIRELCDDIGVDAARYFFVARAVDTHMDFDLGLARKKSNDNPVYYAQYAYARICSILRQAPALNPLDVYDLLTHEKETDLLKHINEFTAVVSDAAQTRSPNKICNYIQKLAQYFHSFYGAAKIIDLENPSLMNQRIALLEATKITMHNALDLIGISAPEKM